MSTPTLRPGLLDEVIRGDLRARDELCRDWLPIVLRWCARLGGPRVDSEDAAHDAFMVLLGTLDRLEHPDRFPSWVYGITRRVLAKHRRRAWVRRWVPGPVPEVTDSARAPDSAYELSDSARRVQRALMTLPEAQREVLILSDVEERSGPEVAELLQIPVGTVASRLRLARAKFERAAEAESLAPDPVVTAEAPAS